MVVYFNSSKAVNFASLLFSGCGLSWFLSECRMVGNGSVAYAKGGKLTWKFLKDKRHMISIFLCARTHDISVTYITRVGSIFWSLLHAKHWNYLFSKNLWLPNKIHFYIRGGTGGSLTWVGGLLGTSSQDFSSSLTSPRTRVASPPLVTVSQGCFKLPYIPCTWRFIRSLKWTCLCGRAWFLFKFIAPSLLCLLYILFFFRGIFFVKMKSSSWDSICSPIGLYMCRILCSRVPQVA